VVARMPRKQVITGERLRPGLAIVGLYSGGRANYEKAENSGLGSNGFTMLRHEFLSAHYKRTFPEAFAPEIADLAYTGRHRMSDPVPGSSLTVGQALLSPTRTYAPILKPPSRRPATPSPPSSTIPEAARPNASASAAASPT
jgi:phosphoribosylformylglycinamidine cyclo-ligase